MTKYMNVDIKTFLGLFDGLKHLIREDGLDPLSLPYPVKLAIVEETEPYVRQVVDLLLKVRDYEKYINSDNFRGKHGTVSCIHFVDFKGVFIAEKKVSTKLILQA